MRGAPPTHVVRMRTTLTVEPKLPLLSRHWATAGLAVGLRACVLPTGKFPPLAPLGNKGYVNYLLIRDRNLCIFAHNEAACCY